MFNIQCGIFYLSIYIIQQNESLIIIQRGFEHEQEEQRCEREGWKDEKSGRD